MSQVATTTKVRNGVLTITYHNTDVVMVYPDHIRLDTGGFFTATTKKRMNEASLQYDLKFAVLSKNKKWYVSYNSQLTEFTGDFIVFKK